MYNSSEALCHRESKENMFHYVYNSQMRILSDTDMHRNTDRESATEMQAT